MTDEHSPRSYLLVVLTFYLIFSSTLSTTHISDLPINEEDISLSDTINKNSVIINPESVQNPTSINMSDVEFGVLNTPYSFDGYNLFVLCKYDFSETRTDSELVIMDMDGNMIAQIDAGQVSPLRTPAEFIDPDTVLVGVQGGAALWHINNNSLEYLGFSGHHEYEYNPNNDTFFTLQYNPKEISGTTYYFDRITEYNRTGHEVWSLDVNSFISHTWWCPFKDRTSGNPDISHSNTIYYVADDDVFYYNSRNTNTFFKIDHKTGNVIWSLGEHGDFTMYDINGVERDHLFFHAHSVEPLDNNTFILFDNDLHNQTTLKSRQSRMLEIEINETTMTANVVWRWTAPNKDWYSAGWGDADRLPNGNRLGAFGYWSKPQGGESCYLVEVENEGDVVWLMTFPWTQEEYYGVYRMERFRFTPTLSSPMDQYMTTSETRTVTWNAWYNYRTKSGVTANYTLYVDGESIDSGLFDYDPYWQPTRMSFDVTFPQQGRYNLTLAISDGYGHNTQDSVTVISGGFYILREGPLEFERGSPQVSVVWDGETVTPLIYNITLNETPYQDGLWLGEAISLDTQELENGIYHVFFELFNGTKQVFNETIWLSIQPQRPPIINRHHSFEVSYHWNKQYRLDWTLSDVSPDNWVILLDGIEFDSSIWTKSPCNISLQLPVLSRGFHNITLVANDVLGQSAIDLTLIEILPSTTIIVASVPELTDIQWGTVNVEFTWEVYGVTKWNLTRNGFVLGLGILSGHYIAHEIQSWQGEYWQLGTHNLDLLLSNDTHTESHQLEVEIYWEFGDAFADTIVRSSTYYTLYPEEAIGQPDGNNATIYSDYSDGVLTLDMGAGEEIVDGVGPDFTIYAGGGEYLVFVSNSLNSQFMQIGSYTGLQIVDISGTGLSEARYIRVEYFVGEDIQLDAVEAINYNVPEGDGAAPLISHHLDVNVTTTEIPLTLNWTVSDLAPWSYRVIVDDVLEDTGPWDGSQIFFTFTNNTVGTHNVTLMVYDLFGLVRSDTVMVRVYEPPSVDLLPLGIILGIIGLVTVLVVILFKHGKIHR